MRLTSLALYTFVSFAGGCIVYDNACPADGWGDDDTGFNYDDRNPGDRPDVDDDINDDDINNDDINNDDINNDDPIVDDDFIVPKFDLDPNEIPVDSVVISSLFADQDDFDYSTIVNVEFLSEDILPCTSQVRDDELLLSIGVGPRAKVGPVDVVITLDNEETVFIDDGLEVLPAEGEIVDDNKICG